MGGRRDGSETVLDVSDRTEVLHTQVTFSCPNSDINSPFAQTKCREVFGRTFSRGHQGWKLEVPIASLELVAINPCTTSHPDLAILLLLHPGRDPVSSPRTR